MQNQEMDSLYFSYLINLYTSSGELETVEEIRNIKLKYPTFPFENYVKGVFTDAHITYYGMDFLLATSKLRDATIYNYGLNGQNEKNKVQFLLISDNLKRLSNDFVVNDNFSLIDLEKINAILSEMDVFEFINVVIGKPNGVNIIKDIINKKTGYYNIQFLSNNFDLLGREQYILKYICDENFYKFISVIDNNYLNTNNRIEDFIQKYDKYSEVFTKLNNQNLNAERTNKLNAALFASRILPFDIKTVEDIDNYYENRYKAIRKTVNGRDINAVKAIIAKVYYNCEYDQLRTHINDAKKTFQNGNYNYQNLKKYFRLMEIETSDEILKFISDMKYESNIIKKIEDTEKEVASRDVINKLSTFIIIKENEFIYLKGEDFILLLHKIKGYGSYEMASKIYADPSWWLSNPQAKEYISTSLCNQNFFGLVEGTGYVLGFSRLPQGSIIGMGTEDIYMSRKIARNNLNNSKNRFLLADDLVENSKKLYNEVAIKRIVNGIPITPDLVFTQDNYSSKEKDVARFFKIPICILDSKIYSEQMLERQKFYLEHNEFNKYIASLKKMYFSFINNYEIIYKYFSFYEMKQNLEDIVEVFLKSPIHDRIKYYELLSMVKEYGKLIDAKNYMDETYDFIDIKEIEEKIKKKI
jgi:hypothetical protein